MNSVPQGRHASGKRMVRFAAVFGVALSLALSACGSGSEPGANNPVKTGEAPDYYPADYKDVIATSKNEGGSLTIYSNTDQENWEPIFRDFKKKYPWVEKIDANNLDSDEVFQRVLSEQATSGSPADIVVSNARTAWADFGGRPGTLLDYKFTGTGQTSAVGHADVQRVLDVDRPIVHRLQRVAGNREADGAEESGRHRGEGSGQIHRQDHHT